MDERMLDATEWVDAHTEEWADASAEYAGAMREWVTNGGVKNDVTL